MCHGSQYSRLLSNQHHHNHHCSHHNCFFVIIHNHSQARVGYVLPAEARQQTNGKSPPRQQFTAQVKNFLLIIHKFYSYFFIFIFLFSFFWPMWQYIFSIICDTLFTSSFREPMTLRNLSSLDSFIKAVWRCWNITKKDTQSNHKYPTQGRGV